MLNKLWPGFIIISFIYAVFKFNMNELNNAIFESCKQTVEMILSFIGVMCMWNGIMEIIKETTLINKITKCLSPLMKFLFPDINKENKAYKEMSMNIVANLLGLGNAATPFGIKAMTRLKELNNNSDIASRSMITFLVINTSSVTIIPTTVISLRIASGSNNPTEIMTACIITTFLSSFIGLLIDRLFYFIWRRHYV